MQDKRPMTSGSASSSFIGEVANSSKVVEGGAVGGVADTAATGRTGDDPADGQDVCNRLGVGSISTTK